jgi:hypothetical protein
MLHSPGYGPPFRRRRRGMLTHGIMTVLGAGPRHEPAPGLLQPGVRRPWYSLPGIGAVPAPGSQSAPLAGGEHNHVIDHATKITATLSRFHPGDTVSVTWGEPVRPANHQPAAPGRRPAAVTACRPQVTN